MRACAECILHNTYSTKQIVISKNIYKYIYIRKEIVGSFDVTSTHKNAKYFRDWGRSASRLILQKNEIKNNSKPPTIIILAIIPMNTGFPAGPWWHRKMHGTAYTCRTWCTTFLCIPCLTRCGGDTGTPWKRSPPGTGRPPHDTANHSTRNKVGIIHNETILLPY